MDENYIKNSRRMIYMVIPTFIIGSAIMDTLLLDFSPMIRILHIINLITIWKCTKEVNQYNKLKKLLTDPTTGDILIHSSMRLREELREGDHINTTICSLLHDHTSKGFLSVEFDKTSTIINKCESIKALTISLIRRIEYQARLRYNRPTPQFARNEFKQKYIEHEFFTQYPAKEEQCTN